jgi:hypothetical protein
VQRPRIPVWAAARWPNRRPVKRAARWDGLFTIELPGPDQLAELAAEIQELRSGAPADGFDLVIEISAGEDPQPWARAGATWVLTSFGPQPRADEVRAAIDAGVG